MSEIKIAIGCGWRDYGEDWIHIDGGDYDHLDSKDITQLPNEDNSVDILYASHVLEYFDREESIEVLKEWYRVLKKGGKIYISVPDFTTIARLHIEDGHPLWKFHGPITGKMEMGGTQIYHKNIFDEASLGELLRFVGFNKIDLYESKDLIRDVDDHSKAKINNTYISLNMVASK